MGIRSTAKAVILHEDKILLNRCKDERNGDYYTLPGGGQNMYESLGEAVVRECREETGYMVIPIRFAALFEEICDDMDFRARRPEYAHKMLHIFVCRLAAEKRGDPTEIDDAQKGCEWVDVARLGSIRLLPTAVGEALGEIIRGGPTRYLGASHIPFNHG